MSKEEKHTISPVVKSKVLQGIWDGIYTPTQLPEELYMQTADKLINGMFDGYGKDFMEAKFGSADYDMLNELRENLYIFSAAKTETQMSLMTDMGYLADKLKNMSEALVKDWEISTFNEFKVAAGGIYDEYNVNYLKSEYYTAINRAAAAAAWQRIQKEKETLPYLVVVGVDDASTCPICSAAHGVCAPVNSGLWTYFCPPFHWNNCRDTLQQVDEEEGIARETPEGELKDIFNTMVNKGYSDLFMNNPGISKVIFQTTGNGAHPYFSIAPDKRHLAIQNFGLPIPARQ